MRDYVTLGSSPSDEDCLQLGKSTLESMRSECKRYLELIRKVVGPPVNNARLTIKTFSHDFGDYVEAICSYELDDPISEEYAFYCESNSPMTWNDGPKPSPYHSIDVVVEVSDSDEQGTLNVAIHAQDVEFANYYKELMQSVGGSRVECTDTLVYCYTSETSLDKLSEEIRASLPNACIKQSV